MVVGFSLSPGGLLLPYHLGVLAALRESGRLDKTVPIAGSSAGAIATAAHAAGVPETETLEGTIRVSDRCASMGGARGRLLGCLRDELDNVLPHDAHRIINARPGLVGLAHREIWPENRPVLETSFGTRECLIDAVLDSSTFPFFSTNWPVRLVRRRGEDLPRVVVDGFFTVPRNRYGCPDFGHAIDPLGDGASTETSVVDRTVTVSVLPHDIVGLTASTDERDRISPSRREDGDTAGQMSELIRLATQPSSREELIALYEGGAADAERWARKEEARDFGTTTEERRGNFVEALREGQYEMGRTRTDDLR